jgi:steroid 5-alpha reductase family enzyme
MEDMNPVLLSLIISMVIQAFFFAFAATLKTDKVTDLSYGLTFIIIANYWLFRNSDTAGLFEVLLTAAVTVWGLRIAGYLLVRILKTGVDHRFDDKRDDFVKFGKFWLLQGIAVWLITIPVVYLINQESAADLSVVSMVGLAVFLTGLIIETFADAQLYKFRFITKAKDKKTEWIDEGLWHYSQHPNYFGEMLVWWGLFISGLQIYTGVGWLAIIGPVFITILLRYVSGIPLLQKANEKRWGKNKEFVTYRKSTNLLILGPKK